MKVFCYFVEPASYSLDLAKNIYEKNNIDYCFIKSTSLVKSEEEFNKELLEEKSVFAKLRFVFDIFKKNDLIIINGYNNYPFIITFLLNFFFLRKRYIAAESDTQLATPNNQIKRFIKWVYLSFIFHNRYVLGFAGGNNSHKELFRNYGMNEERIFLMPMMVNNAKFYQAQRQYPEIFTFLYVGRLVKHKNVENLIRQFNNHFYDKNAILRIVGEGEEQVYLKNEYTTEKVIFVGKKFEKELIQQFQDASCFVCPSVFEPWGLVVNEALSSGLPVIATKEVGATFDLIAKKATGFVASDMSDFGNKMLELYNDSKNLMTYSENATKLMKDYWNYDLYKKCLNEAIKKVELWR